MKYVCMARSGFLPEFNINAKSVYFNPRFFPTTGSMIYWQVKDDGFHIQPNCKMLRSSDQGRLGGIWRWQGLALRLRGEWTGTAAGASFLFAPTFSCDTNCEINSERVGGLILCAVHQHRNIEFHHSHIWGHSTHTHWWIFKHLGGV